MWAVVGRARAGSVLVRGCGRQLDGRARGASWVGVQEQQPTGVRGWRPGQGTRGDVLGRGAGRRLAKGGRDGVLVRGRDERTAGSGAAAVVAWAGNSLGVAMAEATRLRTAASATTIAVASS